jgi:hypothetical protein
MMQGALRLFQVCAALVVLGLIVRLCMRGLLLRDTAGWSSSLLGAGIVRVLYMAVPASVVPYAFAATGAAPGSTAR